MFYEFFGVFVVTMQYKQHYYMEYVVWETALY